MTTAPSILDLWRDLVDPRTGIVREVKELFIDDDEPAFVHYLSYAADTAAFGFLPNFGNNGGVGTTPHGAIAKALGEAVERYCSAMFRPEHMEWATYLELEAPATHPDSYALYSPKQYSAPGFPWAPFTERTTAAWVRGTSLVTGADTMVPACFTYVPYHFSRDRGESPVTQPISTGLACGATYEDAVLSALSEVVERDAFTLTWQAMLSPPRVDPRHLSTHVSDLIERFQQVGLKIHLIDITSDVGCPTVLSVAEGFVETSPAVAVAAASHPDPEIAARKSLEELAHTRKYAAQVMDYLPELPVDVENGHPLVDDQRGHLRYYCPQSAKKAARFLWSGEASVSLANASRLPGPGLDCLVTAVAAIGQDVVAVDLTSPDVVDLGLSVVRVIVPGFHPLQMGHANRSCGGRRLSAALRAAGREPDHDNPHPHPFP